MSDSPLSYRWPKPKGGNQSAPIKVRPSGEPSHPPSMDDAILQSLSQTSPILKNTHEPVVWQGTCLVAVNGVELITTPEGVVYWPAEDAVLVADLHLEKGSSMARRGQLIPPYDTHSTLTRLAACLDKWQPTKVIALGDSFHDSTASERLDGQSTAALIDIMSDREWVWITGNHDPEPPADLDGKVCAEWRHGGLTLRHEPQPNCESGEIAGHLHPKARLIRRGRSVRRSCFVVDQIRMILPSFGAYTGGLNVLDPAFAPLFSGRGFHALMRGKNQVYKIDAQELR